MKDAGVFLLGAAAGIIVFNVLMMYFWRDF